MRKDKSPPSDDDLLTARFEDYLRRPSKQKLAAVVRLAYGPIWNLALRTIRSGASSRGVLAGSKRISESTLDLKP